MQQNYFFYLTAGGLLIFVVRALFSIKKNIANNQHYYPSRNHGTVFVALVSFAFALVFSLYLVFTNGHFTIGTDPRLADLETRIEAAEKLCGVEAK